MSEAGDMDEIVKEFLVESHENLDQLDRDLVALEQDPRSGERLASIFRTIHTVKGTCGFLGFTKLESVSHAGENLLGRLRDGRLTLSRERTNALLAMVDAVRQMLSSIEAAGHDGEADHSELIERLNHLQAETSEPAGGSAAAPEPTAADPTPAGQDAPSPQTGAPAADAEAHHSAVSDSTIRVDVGLLDKLMNLAGELVLARNQILQFSATQEDAALLATSQRLNLITTELQEGVMKTRMQPIGNIWAKFPRVVRDLALACGKQVRIEMEGRETELDKTIIEAIKDPLTHVVRNAVDHGIEPPEQRRAAGKPAEGRLFMRAYHEGGQVNIEVIDDGAGIDLERIRQKAVQRGLITAEQAARFSERETIALVFAPGFSTAAAVTNVSGRGVGMDVVKTNIETIGGTVDVQSRAGHGTTLRIKIPLTLAIIPALIVTSGGDRYAIPQVSLLELVRLEGEQARKGIELIHGSPVYRLRGHLLPLVYLSRELAGGEACGGATHDDAGDSAVNIVVLQADDRQFGLVVEGINDTEEIVVKPLSKQLKGIRAFAGATIMGDGKVALIVDVLGIAQRASVVSEVRDRPLIDADEPPGERRDDRLTLLLLGTADGGRLAVALSSVARLEEFSPDAIERVGGQEVVQYRGEILPLIRLSSVLGGKAPEAPAPGGSVQVVVYQEGGRSAGLVVDRIVDTIEDTLTISRRSSRPGVLGSAILQQRITEVLDVPSVIRSVDPSFFDHAAAA